MLVCNENTAKRKWIHTCKSQSVGNGFGAYSGIDKYAVIAVAIYVQLPLLPLAMGYSLLMVSAFQNQNSRRI